MHLEVDRLQRSQFPKFTNFTAVQLCKDNSDQSKRLFECMPTFSVRKLMLANINQPGIQRVNVTGQQFTVDVIRIVIVEESESSNVESLIVAGLVVVVFQRCIAWTSIEKKNRFITLLNGWQILKKKLQQSRSLFYGQYK